MSDLVLGGGAYLRRFKRRDRYGLAIQRGEFHFVPLAALMHEHNGAGVSGLQIEGAAAGRTSRRYWLDSRGVPPV